jgi:putative tryptophan/tyrosine transport system substrate-binding protein
MRRREFMATLGGAAAWPLVAWPQQPVVPVVGFLSNAPSEAHTYAPFVASFRRGLVKLAMLKTRMSWSISDRVTTKSNDFRIWSKRWS